jgi:hypothetical protein
MRVYLSKLVCIVLFIAVVLLVAASPASAHSTMVLETDCHCDVCQETATALTCCINADYPVDHIIMINLTQPSRISPNINKIFQVSQPASMAYPTFILSKVKPLDNGPGQVLPLISGVNYRCRSCLTQEEPPLD